MRVHQRQICVWEMGLSLSLSLSLALLCLLKLEKAHERMVPAVLSEITHLFANNAKHELHHGSREHFKSPIREEQTLPFRKEVFTQPVRCGPYKPRS